ncbi:hypothetical protein DL769_010200 [Monosporascus sp. CRB-8-3]|nr:hypothetical protein DL769_010200 [Monosporascus sp. CRB-8-3]
MPRFPVTFRRKSTATAEDPNGAIAGPSFRVLDRSEGPVKTFDGGARMARASAHKPKTSTSDIAVEDNLFAGMTNNRSSASSNTTKTTSDNSSRHSAASTAPSSTDYPPYPPQNDDGKTVPRKPVALEDIPPVHKSSSGFLRQAGRTFSFGNKKNSLSSIPPDEPVPAMPETLSKDPATPGGRSRAPTTSTVSTATPPRVDDRDFMMDLGGELSSMLSKFDKRSSVATLKERNLTANRAIQPSPLKLDASARVEPPQHSWNSQTSHDGLLDSGRAHSPPRTHRAAPPPVPQHNAGPSDHRQSEDDEDTTLLRDSLAATHFLNSSATVTGDATSRYHKSHEGSSRFRRTLTETYEDDENMFANSPARREKFVPNFGMRSKTDPQTKVMTREQFEQYRAEKVRQERMDSAKKDGSDTEDDGVNYDDDEEDEAEKTRKLARQRQKQEAHMAVYRQQMMKVTGESTSNPAPAQPSLSISMSTPNLTLNDGVEKSRSTSPPSDASSDEDVPLAILQAHGFPNKARPPTRLSTVPSNPNLKASMAPPPHVAGPGSVSGEGSVVNGGSGGHLPPFARKLPPDPYLGAGLINKPPRESFALGGGAPAANQNPPLPTGGLVGVIASEERSRALRRGSPAAMAPNFQMNGGFDPVAGIPPQMMYPMNVPQMQAPMMTPGDQAQMQMTQQMTQFMQMQMQFMQLMATQGQGQAPVQGQVRPQGHLPTSSVGSLPDIPRNSFLGDSMSNGMNNGMGLAPPRGEDQMRTMSMVQPSSASWMQQPPQQGLAPSIRVPGTGYAPSIAPSERSNIGLPGRYRPVSSVMQADQSGRTSTMSGALPSMPSKLHTEVRAKPMSNKDDDDDDEEGWEAMKAKREKKKSMWRSKKSFGDEIGALIN